jgi:hypothetical protein
MRRGILALAVVCAVLAQTASASPARTPTPAAATAALGRYLHQLYGGIHGYWTCPGPAIERRVDCIAEVRAGNRWHQVELSAWIRRGVIAFTTTTNEAGDVVVSIGCLHRQSWVRRWSPYSRHYIQRSREDQVPGVVSVNGPAYDWGWLALGAERLKDRETHQVGAVDGYTGPGVGRFFSFTCSRRGALITCRNALGDAMRYRP